MKTIYCPKCNRKVGIYDGKSMIDKEYGCHKCKKMVILRTEDMTIETAPWPKRTSASGMTYL